MASPPVFVRVRVIHELKEGSPIVEQRLVPLPLAHIFETACSRTQGKVYIEDTYLIEWEWEHVFERYSPIIGEDITRYKAREGILKAFQKCAELPYGNLVIDSHQPITLHLREFVIDEPPFPCVVDLLDDGELPSVCRLFPVYYTLEQQDSLERILRCNMEEGDSETDSV